MKLAAFIAILLSLIGLLYGQNERCKRVVRYNCFQPNIYCYEIIVCEEQAKFFYETFEDCEAGCFRRRRNG